MKARILFVTLLIASLALPLAVRAGSTGWAGEYRDDKYLGGRAVFQLTIEQSGSAMQVSFDAAWVDGHGAAPEAQGPATMSGNTLTFKFKDTFDNSGTGTIRRAGDAIIVTINTTNVVEPRCLGFYGKNFRLTRVVKK